MTCVLSTSGLVVGLLGVLWLRSRLLVGHSRTWLGLRDTLAGLVQRRLGGYRHVATAPDPSKPERVQERLRVAVVGAGLGGIGAAVTLAEAGAEVVLLDKNPYLGGKLGAWREATSDGSEQPVEHGFHAFFRHYHNLNDFLDRLGIRQGFRPISDYQILGLDGTVHSYREVDPAPVLNLVSLASHGVFRWSEILGSQAMHEMDRFLQYDPEVTFAELDHVPFDRFAERAELPASLMLSFNSFSRAFFADPDRLSTAELVRSFHFYYLSTDGGLIYDVPQDHYEQSVLDPIEAHLRSVGVDLRLSTPVERIDSASPGFVVNGKPYDAVVLATDVNGTRALAERAPWLAQAAPTTAAQLSKLCAGQRYSVLRLWLDGPIEREVAEYLVFDRQRALDAMAFLDRLQDTHRRWAEQTGGTVLELHSYALPDDLADDEVAAVLLEELVLFFPEVADRTVLRQHVQLRHDFPAFHTGLWADRPTTETELPGLVLAGDWVKLPFPSALMEGAFTSGMLAANAILKRAGVRQAQVWSVPPKGILVGVPEMPGKRRVDLS
ncbi:MAG: FAD-dependent oxidoreductase [Myxococcales bacterium]|nr:FAD-dependent oxidoreductase [Myxococcales bacterium]